MHTSTEGRAHYGHCCKLQSQRHSTNISNMWHKPANERDQKGWGGGARWTWNMKKSQAFEKQWEKLGCRGLPMM